MDGEFDPGTAPSGRDVSGAAVVVGSEAAVDPPDISVDDELDELSHALATSATARIRIASARRGVRNRCTSAGYR